MDFVMSLHGLTQLVNNATGITKRSSTLIDVILSTNPSQCILTDVIHTSYSDHSLVYTVLCSMVVNNKLFVSMAQEKCTLNLNSLLFQMSSELHNLPQDTMMLSLPASLRWTSVSVTNDFNYGINFVWICDMITVARLFGLSYIYVAVFTEPVCCDL